MAEDRINRKLAGILVAYIFDYQNSWSDEPEVSLLLGRQTAVQAVATDPNEPFVRFVSALVAMFEKNLERAKSEIDLALSLNPNYAMAYNALGSIHTFSGHPLDAIPMIERAMRLNPAYGQQYLHFLGIAYLLAGKYETAAAILRQRFLLVPETDFSRGGLASALGHLGEVDEARRVWRELKEINPKYSFQSHFGRQPFQHAEDPQRIAEGLQKAGLPLD